MLVNCKTCGKEIGKGVKECVHCGADQRNFFMKHKIITGILAIVIIAGIGSAMGGGNKTAQTTAPAPATTQTTTASAPATQAETPKSSAIKAGMYKVGSDLSAGEYVLISNGSSYFQVSKDSTGALDSIVCNDTFTNRSYVTINAGQYFEFKNCSAYPTAQAPTVDTSSGVLNAGMYIVGKDFSAGEYKVEVDGANGYFEVDKDSLHSINSISANDMFTGSKYVTVKTGQYIKLNNAKLYLK